MAHPFSHSDGRRLTEFGDTQLISPSPLSRWLSAFAGFAGGRASSVLSRSHPDVMTADQRRAQTPEHRTCPTLPADLQFQHYFTLSLLRFSLRENVGAPSTALVLIKNMILTPLLILKNLVSFNWAKQAFILLKSLFFFFLSYDYSSSNHSIKAWKITVFLRSMFQMRAQC